MCTRKPMKITINNEAVETPREGMTVLEVLEWRGVSSSGTAVAVNNKLVTRLQWDSTLLAEGDDVTVISAAFGG